MPPLPTLPRTLQKEIAPFGDSAASIGVAFVEPNDPVITQLSEHGEEAYRVMERTEPIVKASKAQRVGMVVQSGSRVEAGEAGTKDAEDLKAWAVHFLKGVRRWPEVQKQALDMIYMGWVPINRLFSSASWRGRPYWSVPRLVPKLQDQFRFTAKGRDLVYIDSLERGHVVFDSPIQRLRWMAPSHGNLDSPYGDALFKSAWLIWFIKSRFMRMWAEGMAASMGILKASKKGGGAFDGLASYNPDGEEKTVDDYGQELLRIRDHLARNNILIEMPGWILEILSDIGYSDGWKEPLRYCDELMMLVISGQTLTMSLPEAGARAAAETHRKGLIDLAKGDAKALEGWANDDLLSTAISLNWGDVPEDLMPRWRTRLGKEVDEEKVKIFVSAGKKIDWKALSDEWHVPVVCDAVTGEVLDDFTPATSATREGGEERDPADPKEPEEEPAEGSDEE